MGWTTKWSGPACEQARPKVSQEGGETKGWAPPAAETSHTAVGMGAKAKEIKEIDLEELDDEGAQAQAGAKHAGKMAKSPKTKRRALMPMKKDRQTVGTEAKANNGVGNDWDDSNAKSPGGRANNESSGGYDTPPPSLHWGMEELQQRVYQEWTVASVFMVAVTNACLLGMGGIDKAEGAIQAILNPWRGGPTALEGALDPELSKAWAYITILADYQLGFLPCCTTSSGLIRSSGPATPSAHRWWHLGGRCGRTAAPRMCLSSRKTRGPYSKASTCPGSW